MPRRALIALVLVLVCQLTFTAWYGGWNEPHQLWQALVTGQLLFIATLMVLAPGSWGLRLLIAWLWLAAFHALSAASGRWALATAEYAVALLPLRWLGGRLSAYGETITRSAAWNFPLRDFMIGLTTICLWLPWLQYDWNCHDETHFFWLFHESLGAYYALLIVPVWLVCLLMTKETSLFLWGVGCFATAAIALPMYVQFYEFWPHYSQWHGVEELLDTTVRHGVPLMVKHDSILSRNHIHMLFPFLAGLLMLRVGGWRFSLPNWFHAVYHSWRIRPHREDLLVWQAETRLSELNTAPALRKRSG